MHETHPSPEQITEAESDYHRNVWQEFNHCQRMVEHWMAHLGQRYQLKSGDRVDMNGQILRSEPPSAAPIS